MASAKDIEKLKADWMRDGSWDIEDTEGFEEHREELLKFRNIHENLRSSEERIKICGRVRETLLDQFAGQAMAGMLADPQVNPTKNIAFAAYNMAEHMVEEHLVRFGIIRREEMSQ